jgi:afadin
MAMHACYRVIMRSDCIVCVSIVDDVLDVLSSTMTQLRRCRVNAALTIQLFSQLFHFINMWLFNKLVLEPRLYLCTRMWGHLLKRRLGRIEKWAEKQGLELAAECHLARIIQV